MLSISLWQETQTIFGALLKKGNWEAYSFLYDEYYSMLNNYGYKFTKDISLIEDSIHDLFVKLWTNRLTLGEPVSVKNYLYKAFRNTLLRKVKSESRFTMLDAEEHSYPFEVSFDQVLIRNEEEIAMQETIKAVLDRLPSRQKEIGHDENNVGHLLDLMIIINIFMID